jgi:hypothetical protein
MRLRSTDVRPVGFRADSVGSTSNPSERIPSDSTGLASVGSRDGMGWGGKGSKSSTWKPATNELPPLKERRAREFAWAAEHLPNEHTGSVVSALIGLEVAGEKQSTASVMARLERQGRTKAQGWIR